MSDISILEAIKKTITLVDVANLFGLRIREVGRGRYCSCCPMPSHDDKNASFYIDLNKGTFHCFGCQAKGDAINLFATLKKMTLKQALPEMVKVFKVILPKSDYQPTEAEKEANQYFKAMKVAQQYYSSLMVPENTGLAYLLSRGVSKEIINTFGLGFSPRSPEGLFGSLKGAGIDPQLASKIGLAVKSKTGNWYDPFFGRVIFPVYNPSGKITGFGGRDLEGKTVAKYKNTAAHVHFNKSQLLYGLAQATYALQETGSAILTEGYMDVLMMHQYGFKNTVGSMGTAVCADQLALLKGRVKKIIILMDGDGPGRKAALRAVKLALECGFEVEVVLLEQDHDPDSFLRTFGAEKMTQAINDAQKGLGFLLETLEREGIDEVASWVKQFLLTRADKIAALIWAKKIGQYLGVNAETLLLSIGFHHSIQPPNDSEVATAALQ